VRAGRVRAKQRGRLDRLQYRANFFIQLLQSAVAVRTAIVVLKLVYSHTND
jgi:ABC-type uncharacterized transport system permease subunit